MTFELAMQLCLLFFGLFVVGSLLCLPLFSWNFKKFFASKLWTKVVWWIPIFGVFMLIIAAGTVVAVLVTIALLLQAFREFRKAQATNNTYAKIYLVLFTAAILHIGLFFMNIPNDLAIRSLIVVCFASALSDVCAFFFGSYFGQTPLPSWINDRKSWEGVFGQIIGALLGYALIWCLLGIYGFWLIAVGIGLASALGDLANSTAKRSLRIEDWGQSIPGHGGVLDRFSSLSVAIAWTFWVIRY